ncbi:MAG: hypothetical protein CFE21_01385 [Bacteroidetes bacterium B1(2017)]|nr:MAG: hypothetical protein CFE21_01385 [Bacteroidetes bacterium B1(2017)]
MKKFVLVSHLLFILIGSNLAQTKVIAWKSHSGSMKQFKLAFESEAFELPNSNLGMAPERYITTAFLDTLICVNDSTAIMVTSEHCDRRYSQQGSIWQAGRDTVYHHPIFSKKHDLNFIKTELQQNYNFNNPVEKTVFIGYDNKGQKKMNGKAKENSFPLIPETQVSNKTPFTLLNLVAFVLLIAMAIGIGMQVLGSKKSYSTKKD